MSAFTMKLVSAVDFSESVGRLEKEAGKTKGILKASGNMSHVTWEHVSRDRGDSAVLRT